MKIQRYCLVEDILYYITFSIQKEIQQSILGGGT